MKIGGMGGFELVIILIIVLIIFGPKNLPKLGKALGNGIKGLRKGVQSGKDKIDEKFDEVEEEKASVQSAAEQQQTTAGVKGSDAEAERAHAENISNAADLADENAAYSQDDASDSSSKSSV